MQGRLLREKWFFHLDLLTPRLSSHDVSLSCCVPLHILVIEYQPSIAPWALLYSLHNTLCNPELLRFALYFDRCYGLYDVVVGIFKGEWYTAVEFYRGLGAKTVVG